MKIRHKEKGWIGSSNQFNIHGLGEMIVCFDDGADSDFIRDYDVFIESEQKWIDMYDAFEQHLIITDNYNTRFCEPTNEEDKARGYYL